MTDPVCVRFSLVPARAMPKSVTFTVPVGVMSTLPGFTSRCTTPCSCANDSAAAISIPMSDDALRVERALGAHEVAQ